MKFVDYDGDGTIGFGDRQYMGSATPKTTFAWTLGFTWKKLSFSAMFQGVGGAQAMNVSKYMLLSDVEGNFNRSREYLERLVAPITEDLTFLFCQRMTTMETLAQLQIGIWKMLHTCA